MSESEASVYYRSVAGTSFLDTPWILPVRGYMEDVKRLMVGDVYTGRRCGAARSLRLRATTKSSSTVSGHSLARGSSATVASPRRATRTTSSLVTALSPSSHDQEALPSYPPNARVLDCLAKLREEPPSDEGSWADEGAPFAGARWRGSGNQMMIGSGCTSREFCDGQSLASPGRWKTSCSQVSRKSMLEESGPLCRWILHIESGRRVC